MIFKQIISWSIASALVVISGSAAASGFALYEHGSGLGNAFAGGAASAEDASTIYFNPAGLSRLSGKQIVVAAHAIRPSMKFANTASVPAMFQPSVGGNGGDAGSWALVPNGYFAMEIDPQWKLGIGVNSPFGLQTKYDAAWIGRFQAIKSKIQTININPSLSYQINDVMSVGGGLSYQRISGELTSAVNWAAIAFNAAGGGAAGLAAATALNAAGQGEGLTAVTGNDGAWGYNFGMLFEPTIQTRVGLAYRSTIKYNLSGTVSFTNRPTAAVVGVPLAAGIAAATPNETVSLAIKMPDIFSASVFHIIDEKWDAMADATWMGWSVFQRLNILRPNGTTLGGAPTQENWRDTWRVAVGSNYHYSDQWTARIGAAYDQTPVSDAFRTARVPDAARYQLAVGGQYKPGKNSALDFGYTHLFVNNASIADMQGAGKGNLIGNYKNSVDILSVAYAYSF